MSLWQDAEEFRIERDNYQKSIKTDGSDAIYFVIISTYNVRKKFGKFVKCYSNNEEYAVVPSALVSAERKYQYTKTSFIPRNLQDEFRLNERVVVLNEKFCGYSGKVIGWVGEKKVKVELEQRLQNIPPQIINKVKGNMSSI